MRIGAIISTGALLVASVAAPAIAVVGLGSADDRTPQVRRPRPISPQHAPVTLPSGRLPSGLMPSGYTPSGGMPSGGLPSGDTPSGGLPSGGLAGGSLPGGVATSTPGGMHPTMISPEAASDIGGYRIENGISRDSDLLPVYDQEPETNAPYYEYRGFRPGW